MKPDEFNGLALPDENDDEAVREFGRQIAMDGILREAFASAEAKAEASSSPKPKVNVGDRPGQRKTNRNRTLLFTAVAAMAACVLGLIVLRREWTPRPVIPRPLADVGIHLRDDLAITGWEISAYPEAKAERIDANTLRLTQGELTLVAREDDVTPIKVITPNSEFNSTGSRCFIGVHRLTKSITGEPPMLKQMTRVFLMAGLATLSNDLGSVNASADQLVHASGKEAPVALTVHHNTQFAADLYKQLAGNSGENLFVSPLSVSNTLAMLLEGTRGETAAELGRVLHLPEATRRTGDDSQRIPWETAKIYSGITQLNDILERNTDEAIMRQQMKVDALSNELAAIRKKARDFDKSPPPKIAKLKEEASKQYAEARKLRSQRKQQTKGSAEYNDLSKQINEIMDSASSRSRIVRAERNKVRQPLYVEEKRVAKEFNAALELLGGYQLKVAHAVWVEQTLPVNQNYVDTVNKAFKTGGVQLADFRNRDERDRINDWVADNTNQKIQDLLQPGDLTEDTRLVLANAIYFQGDWQFPFETRKTKSLPFTKSDGSQIQTPMMSERFFEHGLYGAVDGDGSVFAAPQSYDKNDPPRLYPDERGFHLLSLPYRGDEVSMVWLAPMSHDGLPNIESKLSSETLTEWLGALQKRSTHVKVPKFRLEESYELEEVLAELGLATLFRSSKEIGGADLTGILDGPSDGMSISRVIHKTFVDVNEKGTEAATATLALAKTDSEANRKELVPFIPEFTADRPFLFLIRHNQTGAILFMGRVMNPAG